MNVALEFTCSSWEHAAVPLELGTGVWQTMVETLGGCPGLGFAQCGAEQGSGTALPSWELPCPAMAPQGQHWAWTPAWWTGAAQENSAKSDGTVGGVKT